MNNISKTKQNKSAPKPINKNRIYLAQGMGLQKPRAAIELGVLHLPGLGTSETLRRTRGPSHPEECSNMHPLCTFGVFLHPLGLVHVEVKNSSSTWGCGNGEVPRATQPSAGSPAPGREALLAAMGALPPAGSSAELCRFFFFLAWLPRYLHRPPSPPLRLGTFPKVC